MIRIILVTSDREHCGIREYGRFLMSALKDDQEIEISEFPNPDSHALGLPACEVIHLNHHAALHSSWTKERVEEYQRHGYRITVTQHDTFEDFTVMQERGFTDFRQADGLVVHEPVEGLTHDAWPLDTFIKYPHVQYIPQGVLSAPNSEFSGTDSIFVGSAGFDFPWKNFDMLARVTKEAKLGLLLVSPGMTEERKVEIQTINPYSTIVSSWCEAPVVVEMLSTCLATAFLYSTGNSGTSGAIRLGVAARRPMIAFASRQNRDLVDNCCQAISWTNSEKHAQDMLQELSIHPILCKGISSSMSRLADRDSWENVAKKYKDMWKTAMEEK